MCVLTLLISVGVMGGRREKKRGRGRGKRELDKQGRIHGNPVADGWAGAVMRKPLAILEIFRTDRRTDGRTDGPTDRHGKV